MTAPDTTVTVEVHRDRYVVSGTSPVDVARVTSCLREAGFVADPQSYGVLHAAAFTPEQDARIREIVRESLRTQPLVGGGLTADFLAAVRAVAEQSSRRTPRDRRVYP